MSMLGLGLLVLVGATLILTGLPAFAVLIFAAVVGALCGAVSSLVAMPLVPLFDSHATPVPALDLTPSLLAVVGSAVLGAVVVVLVGVLAAFATGRRIELRRVREAL